MKFALIVLLTALLTAGTGCPGREDPVSPPPSNLSRFPQDANELPEPVTRLMIRMGLSTVEVPAGKASGSEDIWSYLDEESAGPDTAAALGRNGLRVGVGKLANWPDVKAMLTELTGQQVSSTVVPLVSGSPVPIRLKRRQPVQTVFFSRDDLSLTGEDYPPGTNQFLLSCTMDRDDRTRVLVTGVPQIETTKRTPKLVDRNGSRGFVPLPDWHTFRFLRFQLPVANDEFLVIGPGR
ncbi:MAG: hypothetical protein ACLFV7_00890, partial [Phycisphaerae bacterium]